VNKQQSIQALISDFSLIDCNNHLLFTMKIQLKKSQEKNIQTNEVSCIVTTNKEAANGCKEFSDILPPILFDSKERESDGKHIQADIVRTDDTFGSIFEVKQDFFGMSGTRHNQATGNRQHCKSMVLPHKQYQVDQIDEKPHQAPEAVISCDMIEEEEIVTLQTKPPALPVAIHNINPTHLAEQFVQDLTITNPKENEVPQPTQDGTTIAISSHIGTNVLQGKSNIPTAMVSIFFF
jgi:hypothetical protein